MPGQELLDDLEELHAVLGLAKEPSYLSTRPGRDDRMVILGVTGAGRRLKVVPALAELEQLLRPAVTA